MKKILTVSLAAIICFHLSGIYCFFLMRLMQIHDEMEAELAEMPVEGLQKIEISFAEYQNSIVEENEVRINGRMFDVAKVIVKEDAVVILGLQDEEEDDLLSVFEHFFTKIERVGKAPRTLVISFFAIYLPSTFSLPTLQAAEITPFGFVADLYHSFKPLLNTPPPRTAALRFEV